MHSQDPAASSDVCAQQEMLHIDIELQVMNVRKTQYIYPAPDVTKCKSTSAYDLRACTATFFISGFRVLISGIPFLSGCVHIVRNGLSRD